MSVVECCQEALWAAALRGCRHKGEEQRRERNVQEADEEKSPRTLRKPKIQPPDMMGRVRLSSNDPRSRRS